MPKLTKTASTERLQFVEPLYARAVQQLPEGKTTGSTKLNSMAIAV